MFCSYLFATGSLLADSVLFGLFYDIPVQMCQFHQIQIVQRYLTRKPKSPAAMTYRNINESLKHTISEQRMEISRLNHRLGSKDREILMLKRELISVQEKLSQYEKPTKDSHNSSIAPSQEPIASRALRRTVSLTHFEYI